MGCSTRRPIHYQSETIPRGVGGIITNERRRQNAEGRADRLAVYASRCGIEAATLAAMGEADWIEFMLRAGVKVNVDEAGNLMDTEVRMRAVNLVVAKEEAEGR